MIFASRSLFEHLARGAIGATCLAGAVVFGPDHLLAWGLVPIALVALRGCPTCWTLGLIETITRRHRRE